MQFYLFLNQGIIYILWHCNTFLLLKLKKTRTTNGASYLIIKQMHYDITEIPVANMFVNNKIKFVSKLT